MRVRLGLGLHRCVDCAYWELALTYFGEPTGQGGCRFSVAHNRKGDKLRECANYRKAVEETQAKEILLLHGYSQPYEHFEARVVGNDAGLRALRDAIVEALREGSGKTAELFATDGECYQVEVIMMPDDWNDPMWQGYRPHYCDRGYDNDTHKEKVGENGS